MNGAQPVCARAPRRGRVEHLRHVPGAPALEVRELTVCYRGVPALDAVSLSLAPGERLAVLGPNGAGKSTLLKVIAGVLVPTAGEVRVYGQGPEGHTCIAYLPQRSGVDWTYPLTVADVVAMGRLGRGSWLRRPTGADRARVRDALDQVGLADLARRPIGELSGGQAQRMFIARALAQEAELVLMDEPLAGLDVPAQRDLLALIKGLPGNPTVVVALHELVIARDHFPRILLLRQKVVGLGSPADVFTPDRLREAYGESVELVETPQGTVVVTDSCCGPDPEGGR